MFKIVVNGEPVCLESNINLRELLQVLKIATPAVAIEMNQQIVSSADFERIVLQAGDQLEIVTLVGGG